MKDNLYAGHQTILNEMENTSMNNSLMFMSLIIKITSRLMYSCKSISINYYEVTSIQ